MFSLSLSSSSSAADHDYSFAIRSCFIERQVGIKFYCRCLHFCFSFRSFEFFCATDDQTVNHIKQNTFCLVTRTIMLHILHLVSSNANLIWLKVLDWAGCFTTSFFLFVARIFTLIIFHFHSRRTDRVYIRTQSGEMAIASPNDQTNNTTIFTSISRSSNRFDFTHTIDHTMMIITLNFFLFFLSVVDFMI